MNRDPTTSTAQTQFTTNRTWQKVPTKLLTNAATGQAEVFVPSPPFSDIKIAEVGANNQWAFTENGKSELLKRYNNLNNTNITEQDITKLFFTDGTKTFNNDRASVINKHSSSEARLNFSTKENPIPGVVNPQTGAKTGQTAKTEAPPGAPTQDPSKKGDEGFTPDKDANSLFENPNIPYADGASPRKNIGILKYHGSIDTNGQDYIKFDILEYGTRKLDQGSLQLSQRNFGEAPIGTIILPIQPSISDFNSVTWDEVPMDIVDMTGQLIGLKLMTEGTNGATEIANTVKSKIQDKAISDAIGSAMATFVAQKAVQSNNNLLTRITGAVLNPNMELLFQGPTLRPFQFAFRMTPRDDKEAKQVKSIIRAFKEFSAVQRGIENLFLKTPHVFRIRYMLGTKSNTDHPSINRIKICALQSIQVDYTPDQTYMTYNDDNATMTSYGMSLTFKELEPIYSDDYKTFNTDEIGY